MKNTTVSQVAATGTSLFASGLERLTLTNVVAHTERIQRFWWQEATTESTSQHRRHDFRHLICESADSIERHCEMAGTTPGALAQPTRLAYSWLKYLSDSDNSDAHTDALLLARQTVADNNLDATVLLTNMRSLWRYNRTGDTYIFKVHEGFVNAPVEVWRALLKLRIGDCKRENALVREFAHSDQFCEVAFALESVQGGDVFRSLGKVHDLDESFERVNQRYFNGEIKKPLLTWNKVLTARKFGHYDRFRDTVMISISLDHESVPSFVVDSVMHHELLHKKHGTMFVNGKRISHSADFRREERQFLEYEEADKIIRAVARRLRAR